MCVSKTLFFSAKAIKKNKLFVSQNTTNENKQLQWEEFPLQSKYYFGTINKQDN